MRAPSESSLFPGIVHRRHQPGVYGSTGAKYERKRQPENRTAESVARKSGALARGTTENQVPQRCFDFSFHRLLVVPWCSVPRMLMSLAIRPTLQYWGWASLEISVNFFVSLELFRILTGSARLKTTDSYSIHLWNVPLTIDVARGACPPIFGTYSHFVLWEAVSQTK